MGMVIQDGIRLVRFHTRALLPPLRGPPRGPQAAVRGLGFSTSLRREALSDIRLGYSRTLSALVILERSALHGVKDLRTVGVIYLIFVMQK